jgi:hypothetical protein
MRSRVVPGTQADFFSSSETISTGNVVLSEPIPRRQRRCRSGRDGVAARPRSSGVEQGRLGCLGNPGQSRMAPRLARRRVLTL